MLSTSTGNRLRQANVRVSAAMSPTPNASMGRVPPNSGSAVSEIKDVANNAMANAESISKERR